MKYLQRWLAQHWMWLALAAVVVLNFSVRLYRIDFPLADWHSFRQADTASVTREFVQHGIDLLHPQYHDVSNIQSGELNMDGWRMVEFPIMNALTAGSIQMMGSGLVVTSRLVSILASTISVGLLMWLVWQLHNRSVALLAGLVFALMPYNIYFSRAILPEPFLVIWLLITAVLILEWARRTDKATWWSMTTDWWLVGAAVTFAVALLVKPMAIFFVPWLIGIYWRFRQWKWQSWVKAGMLLGASVLPLLWWRDWIQQYPSGIPASDWLLNGNGIRFRPAWWRWLFVDRLGREMFGYWGVALLPFGLVAGVPAWKTNVLRKLSKRISNRMTKTLRHLWQWKDGWLQQEGWLVMGWVSVVLYFVVFASGNVQHDYYQIIVVPIVAMTWARGADWVVRRAGNLSQQLAAALAVLVIALFSWFGAWYEVKGFFNVNNWAMVPAGEAVQRQTPEDALVIAPGFGDTTLLFHTGRRGWPIGFEIEDKIAQGAQYYVSTSYDDEANELMRQYTVIDSTPEYVLIDLQQPNPNAPTVTEKTVE